MEYQMWQQIWTFQKILKEIDCDQIAIFSEILLLIVNNLIIYW